MRASCGAAAVVAAAGLGCFASVPEADDAALVVSTFGFPAGTSCTLSGVDPDRPGTFGREGLRIEARCVPPEGWTPPASWTPRLPEAAQTLHRPPTLALPPGGRATCWVGVWVTGQQFTPHPCDARPGRYDRHRSAVYDPASGAVEVVLQNLY